MDVTPKFNNLTLKLQQHWMPDNRPGKDGPGKALKICLTLES